MGAKADRLQQEFLAYRRQVRDEAIRVASAHSWCDNGLNETLANLGLWGKYENEPAPAEPARPIAGAPAGTPRIGQPCPAEGTWYARSRESGGPNQCRVWDAARRVYCTRPAIHVPDVHVASGANAGVLNVWTATATDQRGSEFAFALETADEDVDVPSSTRW